MEVVPHFREGHATDCLDTFIIRGLCSLGLLRLPSMWVTWLITFPCNVTKVLAIIMLGPFTPLLLLLSSTYIHGGAIPLGLRAQR